MEHEFLDYKIVMDDGPDTEVLARLAHLDVAGPVQGGRLKIPQAQHSAGHGARTIERHEREPPPAPLIQCDP